MILHRNIGKSSPHGDLLDRNKDCFLKTVTEVLKTRPPLSNFSLTRGSHSFIQLEHNAGFFHVLTWSFLTTEKTFFELGVNVVGEVVGCSVGCRLESGKVNLILFVFGLAAMIIERYILDCSHQVQLLDSSDAETGFSVRSTLGVCSHPVQFPGQ